MYHNTLNISTHYYPFGMPIMGRVSNGESYRYGFGSHEKLDEVSGTGNTVDMGDRWLDVRLGRTSKLDRKATKYPNISPYSYAANNPIFFIDPDGKVIRVHYRKEDGSSDYYIYKPGIKPTNDNAFIQQVHEAVTYVMKNDANNTFQNISDSEKTVNFNEITDHNVETLVRNGEVTINWNPTSAQTTIRGGKQTPATGLLHEAGHAERYIYVDTPEKVDALREDLKENETLYKTAEDQRVIDEIETPYIKATNAQLSKDYNKQPFDINSQWQGTREEHTGIPYTSTGVNSTTPAKEEP